ncbi:MAG: flavodoxin family protein, partial [Clostridia bacterium]|nr:flavodoxin family protein [Clostridia bacterium]
MSKVLLINGSPNAHGCTATALEEIIETLQKEGIQTELVHIGNRDVRGCVSCGKCETTGKCVFSDIVN